MGEVKRWGQVENQVCVRLRGGKVRARVRVTPESVWGDDHGE